MSYGCHNHPPRVDSYCSGHGFDSSGMVKQCVVQNTASKECKYTLNTSDLKCKDCIHAPVISTEGNPNGTN
jgi:hypothetical protein